MDISNIWIGSSGFSLKHVLRIAAPLLVLVSLYLAYGGWLFERNLTTMKTQGVEAVSTVTKMRDEVRHSRWKYSHTHHVYYLTLSWTDGSERVRTFTRKVSSDLFFRVAKKASSEARQVPVRYLPGRPDIQPFIAAEIDDTFNGYLYGAISLFALGLGAAWLAWPPRRATAMAAAAA